MHPQAVVGQIQGGTAQGLGLALMEEIQVVDGLVRCPNPSCISNASWVVTKFLVVRPDPLRVRCHYCERRIREGEFELL